MAPSLGAHPNTPFQDNVMVHFMSPNTQLKHNCHLYPFDHLSQNLRNYLCFMHLEINVTVLSCFSWIETGKGRGQSG